MTTETINGLHSCKPGNDPVIGQVKLFVIEQRKGKSGKPYIKIRSANEENGGTPHRILNAEKTDFVDQHGNISFNLEIEPSSSQPTAFQNARQTMQQGRVPRDSQQGTQSEDFLHQPDSDWPDAQQGTKSEPESPPAAEPAKTYTPLSGDGVQQARKHLMQSANLYNLCVAAVDKAIAPNMPPIAQTSEMFQAAVASLYIEASRDVWWSGKIVRESWINSMPTVPIK